MFANCQLFEASQLIDHVMAPRMDGQVVLGLNVPQLVPRARQLSALLTLDGDW